MLFCNRCGAGLGESARFCDKCGQPASQLVMPASAGASRNSSKPSLPIFQMMFWCGLIAVVVVAGIWGTSQHESGSTRPLTQDEQCTQNDPSSKQVARSYFEDSAVNQPMPVFRWVRVVDDGNSVPDSKESGGIKRNASVFAVQVRVDEKVYDAYGPTFDGYHLVYIRLHDGGCTVDYVVKALRTASGRFIPK